MTKQETIKYLTELMATVQMAHFKGRETGVRVHESSTVSSVAISIDLYHFEGDGLPVCEGLKPCTITFDDGSTVTGNVFCMCYDPDDEIQPLEFEFEGGDNDTPDMYVAPNDMPEEALKNVTAWLEKEIQPNGQSSTVKYRANRTQSSVLELLRCSRYSRQSRNGQWKNDVTSFFFYMWNKWCEEECRLVFGKDDYWPHFWNKWCHFCDKTNSRVAVADFYAELSNDNRDKLVKRAVECYDRQAEK